MSFEKQKSAGPGAVAKLLELAGEDMQTLVEVEGDWEAKEYWESGAEEVSMLAKEPVAVCVRPAQR